MTPDIPLTQNNSVPFKTKNRPLQPEIPNPNGTNPARKARKGEALKKHITRDGKK